MNPKIKELAEQAGYTSLPRFDFAIDLIDEAFLKKFAELIIQECCIKMQDTDSFYDAWISDSSYGEWMSKVIKEHFGVD